MTSRTWRRDTVARRGADPRARILALREGPAEGYDGSPRLQSTKFDAHAWVTLAKAAGMKYITITSRHHDGFAMFATRATRYNIVDWTPFQRDPLKELADECRRQGIKIFFYYSQLDWHHPDYWPRGSTGHRTGRPENGDWSHYLDFSRCPAHRVAHELRSRRRHLVRRHVGQTGRRLAPAPDLRADSPVAAGRADRANHHQTPRPGEDVQTFEQDLPALTPPASIRRRSGIAAETSLTMNDSWGFNLTDHNYKSVRDLIPYLVKAAGQGANLLLNIGPRPDGTIRRRPKRGCRRWASG